MCPETKENSYKPEIDKFSKNLRSHLKILGTRMVTQSKFRSDESQILGATKLSGASDPGRWICASLF